ncbi:MAG: radical SAM protein [Dehalococcoidales bacterium]|nr:radical SAM protein [Dehalococcoidales bacterium]|tara:strand:+ start:152 stop:1648 length:1497 start_codon:yes stop_codon:yes gene_type:complete
MKDFKVLFIYPNTMMATLVPISLSILYPCLKSSGFQVELFDTTYYRTEEISFEQKKVELLQVKEFRLEEKDISYIESDVYADLVKKVETYKPNLIAVTIVEDVFPLALSLLDSIKQFDIPVIAGGVFVTLSPEEVICQKNIDMICIGEGEEPLVELCEKMYRGEDYTNIQNLWVKKNGKIIKNPLRKLVDINQLPYIDFDIFERKRLYRPMYGKIYTMVHIEADRGCPYNCTYCEAPHLRKLFKEHGCGNYYRRKLPSRIMEELRHLAKKYNPDYINFDAESFLARPISELKELSEQYKKEIDLPFWCQSRPETVTEEKIKILKEMNCKNLQFGIEQGNEEFRARILKRSYTNKEMVEALQIVEKYGIRYTVNNIIGFPDETRELIFDTINVNRQINPTTINCYLFTPYKGTYLRQYCVEKGYLDKDANVHQLLDGAELKMNSISYQELKGLQRTFPLYAKMPETEFDKIRIAEKFDEAGNRMFQQLREIYYERYFSS